MQTLTAIPLPLAAGFGDTARQQGIACEIAPDGVYANDPIAAQNLATTYPGSAAELAWWQKSQQAALDALFDAHFDLAKFIRGGTIATITATQVGTFLAQITNNYRSLRAQIAAATTVAAVQAISVSGGWPANP